MLIINLFCQNSNSKNYDLGDLGLESNVDGVDGKDDDQHGSRLKSTTIYRWQLQLVR